MVYLSLPIANWDWPFSIRLRVTSGMTLPGRQQVAQPLTLANLTLTMFDPLPKDNDHFNPGLGPTQSFHRHLKVDQQLTSTKPELLIN